MRIKIRGPELRPAFWLSVYIVTLALIGATIRAVKIDSGWYEEGQCWHVEVNKTFGELSHV
jgi:hypothetical protein